MERSAQTAEFVAGLEFVLCHGISQTKLVTLCQCIEKIQINVPAKEIRLLIRKIPACSLHDTLEITVGL